MAYYKAQIEKFLAKDFTYTGPDYLQGEYFVRDKSCFEKAFYSKFVFEVQGIYNRILGLTTTAYVLNEETGWDKLYQVFGILNKAPRQSIVNLIKRENLTMYLRTNREGTLVQILIGTWANGRFYGVTTRIKP